MTETDLLRAIQLDASPRGVILHRNNVGALTDLRGRVVRFGVGGNGGSDLIGWSSVVITPEMVGTRIAVFTAVEAKLLQRNATPEQARFLDAVQHAGGIGVLAYRTDDVCEALGRFVAAL